MLSRYKDQSIGKGTRRSVMGLQPTMPAIGHSAMGGVPECVMMTGTQAGRRRARAGLHIGAQGNPLHLGSEQRAESQNGQESDGYAHVVCKKAQNMIVADSRWGGPTPGENRSCRSLIFVAAVCDCRSALIARRYSELRHSGKIEIRKWELIGCVITSRGVRSRRAPWRQG
jgi:hypothetical protein